jgi:hypothetical protein
VPNSISMVHHTLAKVCYLLILYTTKAEHNILEPKLGRFQTNSDSKNLEEPLESRLHVSLKWKNYMCGSRGVSIIT